MLIEHRGRRPEVDKTSYVAPNATVSGDVVIGPNCSVLFGAVIAAEGGSVVLGSDCVVMENAVLRGAPGNPLHVGNRVLIGPHAHVSGCVIGDDGFVATGATVFNGAVLGERVEVRINGVVHVNSELPDESMVPIDWVAVGKPAEIIAPNEHDRIWSIQKEMDFPGTVFRSRRGIPKGERTSRYSAGLRKHHGADRIVGEADAE